MPHCEELEFKQQKSSSEESRDVSQPHSTIQIATKEQKKELSIIKTDLCDQKRSSV